MKKYYLKNKSTLGLCLLLNMLISTMGLAQNSEMGKYLLALKDKNNSPYSILKPQDFLSARSIARRQKQQISVNTRDLPVNPAYIADLKKAGAKVKYSSRWMNAVLVEATPTIVQNLLKLSFVKELVVNSTIDNPTTRGGRKASKFEAEQTSALNYGLSNTQVSMIGANVMHEKGFHGEGMLIGVLDDGFYNANSIAALKPIMDEKRIVGTYDFVRQQKEVYEVGGGHGTNVLSCMGSYVEGAMIGTAYKASFLLLRTEDDDSEYLIEEANWLFAAEYADSVGVDLINSSLGYTTFDDAKTDHTYANMNGNTTIAAKAADWAAGVGIVCVISAGNDGSNAWKYIATPADADSIITVGAVNSLGNYAVFSSLGPSADGRVKPDLVSMGQSVVVVNPSGNVATGSGTSYASPILCGMAAGFWQANPTLTAMQLINILRKSGSQSSKPDAFLGYGIPNFERANTILKNVLSVQQETETSFFKAYPNPTTAEVTIDITELLWKEGTMNLMDISGKIIMQEPIKSKKHTFSVSTLSNGIYFLRVITSDKVGIVKIVKE